MAPGTRFCILWLATLVVVLAAMGAFDAAVDPYCVFGTQRIQGFNARKSHAATHQMMAKAYAEARLRPVTLLLGSSRVDIGLDPQSSAFPPAMRPVFNYGVGGAVYAVDLYALREGVAGGRLKYALLVLDFELALNKEPPIPEEDLRRAQLGADLQANPARRGQVLRDAFLSSLTLGAFMDSLGTVWAQHDPDATDMTADGASSDAELRAHTRDDGAVTLFAQKDHGDERRNTIGVTYLAAHPGAVPSVNGIAAIVMFCRQHDINLTLVIPPMHARALDQWRLHGYWNRFEDWKSQIAAIAKPTTPVWDFSAASAWTTEEPTTGGAPRWFWESLHFKRGLGELMLRRIYAGDGSLFGVH
jgi:hypothetical protein